MILNNKNLSELPPNLNCESYIDCSRNFLTTLLGSPKVIFGFFKCNNNMLKNLVGGPIRVELSFNCSSNRLTSLLGAPEFVGGNFWCEKNPELLDVSDLWPTFIRDSVKMSLNENMAILPLIKFNIIFGMDFDPIEKIFDRHRGTSKQNIIDLQYDLMEKGFGDYAKWKPII